MIFDFIRQLRYKWKFRGRGIRIHRTACVRHGSELEGLNYVGENTVFRGTLGRGSYIGARCILHARIGRYDPETIAFLKEIKWWNFPEEWLKSNWMLLNDIEKLKKYPGIEKLAEC